MTLFEDFIEPWEDLSQWGDFIGTPVVADHKLILTPWTSMNTTSMYDIEDSFIQVQVFAPETSEKTESIGLAVWLFKLDFSEINQFRIEYSFETDSTIIHGTTDTFDYDGLVDIFFKVSEDSDTWTVSSSLDGAAWDTVENFSNVVIDTTYALYLKETSDSEDADDRGLMVGPINYIPPVDKTLSYGWNVYSSVNKTLVSSWSQPRPYLRHSTRHLHRTVFDYLSDQLETLGWTVPDAVPFGAPAVVLQDLLPEEWTGDSVLIAGTVAVTLGDEAEAKNQECGGPLALIDVPIFIDIFMDTPGTTLALALDIRDIFCGRLPGSTRYLEVTNYNNVPATIAQGYTVEIEDVVRESQRRNWETVKITANMYFPDSEGN